MLKSHTPQPRISQSALKFSRTPAACFCAFLLLAPFVSFAQDQKQEKDPKKSAKAAEVAAAGNGPALLHCDAADVSSRDLLYGRGGPNNTPPTRFTYEKEDMSGTNAKFDLRDENGEKWRVKLGNEARPETVATRLLWAAGYFSNEEYFAPEIHVADMQPVSKKRRKFVQGILRPDGTMLNVELKRYPKSEKKIGIWKWRENPFSSTREFNGLRVMMALMNNWDVKDVNNGVYAVESACGSSGDPIIYMAADVGATFGTSGEARHTSISKGNLESYRRSKFIRKVTKTYVDFDSPARMTLFGLVNPFDFMYRWRLRWVGKRVPRADAKWMGEVLSHLSRDQIRAAFRSADYSPVEVEGFTDIVSQRIAQLNQL